MLLGKYLIQEAGSLPDILPSISSAINSGRPSTIDTFFGSGDVEAGLLSILGSLEAWLAGDLPTLPAYLAPMVPEISGIEGRRNLYCFKRKRILRKRSDVHDALSGIERRALSSVGVSRGGQVPPKAGPSHGLLFVVDASFLRFVYSTL